MFNRREIIAVGVAAGCVVTTLQAGERLQFAGAPAKALTSITTASSSGPMSVVVVYHPMTFAKVDPPLPVVPPGDRQEQG